MIYYLRYVIMNIVKIMVFEKKSNISQILEIYEFTWIYYVVFTNFTRQKQLLTVVNAKKCDKYEKRFLWFFAFSQGNLFKNLIGHEIRKQGNLSKLQLCFNVRIINVIQEIHSLNFNNSLRKLEQNEKSYFICIAILS